MISIRMQRGGRVHKPVYTLIATDKRNPRDGRFLQKLGQYNPLAPEDKQLVDLKTDSIKEWLGKGAKLSTTVKSLLKKHKVQL